VFLLVHARPPCPKPPPPPPPARAAAAAFLASAPFPPSRACCNGCCAAIKCRGPRSAWRPSCITGKSRLPLLLAVRPAATTAVRPLPHVSCFEPNWAVHRPAAVQQASCPMPTHGARGPPSPGPGVLVVQGPGTRAPSPHWNQANGSCILGPACCRAYATVVTVMHDRVESAMSKVGVPACTRTPSPTLQLPLVSPQPEQPRCARCPAGSDFALCTLPGRG